MVESAFAQTAGAGPAAGSPMSTLINLMPFVFIMVLFYFLMIHPQNKERKKRDEMLKAIQRGDKVLTRGGVYGIVADIKENVLILKISDSSKVEVERSYIDSVQKS